MPTLAKSCSAMRTMPARGAAVGRDDPALAGRVEDRHVVARIPGIVEAAVAEGATLVRIGTAIFGERAKT